MARVLLYYSRLRKESVSAQNDRKQCEIAKGSVKFSNDEKKNKTEQEEENEGLLQQGKERGSLAKNE
jgi:hypothetical protein